MKKLDNLKWSPRWVSHLGCISGCLDYLNRPVSDAWLYGATGHAFILNVTPDLCPSGPTDWNTEKVLKLGENIGYELDKVSGWKGDEELNNLQKRAWEHVKNAIDNNLPCYGWELDIPEFYIIYGYDDTGYFISGPGCDEGKGPIPWRNIGISEIGVVEVHSMRLKDIADDKKTVFDSISYALEYAHNPEPWTDPKSSGGLKGYDTWIESVKRGIAAEFGLAYNAVVWSECRGNLVGFLREASERLNDSNLDKLFKEAINCFDIVRQELETISATYPFSQELEMKPIQIDSRAHRAAESLNIAKESETAGLKILEMLIAKIS